MRVHVFSVVLIALVGCSSGTQSPSTKKHHASDSVAAAREVSSASNEEITNSIGIKLVLIPGGEFLMGSPETETSRVEREGPQHRVQISQPFYLGKYEVTQKEWRTIMGSNPSGFSPTGIHSDRVDVPDTSGFPVEFVTWFDTLEFCNKLSERESLPTYYTLSNVKRSDGSITNASVTVAGGTGYRLPTEAEWEYACRAGTTTPFCFGTRSNGRESNVDGEHKQYGTKEIGTYLMRTTTVGSYSPNAFGLYDMHGNVSEWCFDFFDPTAYQGRGDLTTDPIVTTSVDMTRSARGGGWGSPSAEARSAFRGSMWQFYQSTTLGFRLARTP